MPNRRPVRTATVRGHRWQIRDNQSLPSGMFGLCEDCHLGARMRTLYVPLDGDEKHDLDTVIHEALHAATELEEEAIEETATDIANLLWRIGWRKGE